MVETETHHVFVHVVLLSRACFKHHLVEVILQRTELQSVVGHCVFEHDERLVVLFLHLSEFLRIAKSILGDLVQVSDSLRQWLNSFRTSRGSEEQIFSAVLVLQHEVVVYLQTFFVVKQVLLRTVRSQVLLNLLGLTLDVFKRVDCQI